MNKSIILLFCLFQINLFSEETDKSYYQIRSEQRGSIKSEIYAKEPISINKTSVLSIYVTNTYLGPISYNVKEANYSLIYIYKLLKPYEPNIDYGYKLKGNGAVEQEREKVYYLGDFMHCKEGFNWLPKKLERKKLILLPKESYVRKLCFEKNWASKEEISKSNFNFLGLSGIGIDVLFSSYDKTKQTLPGKKVCFVDSHDSITPSQMIFPITTTDIEKKENTEEKKNIKKEHNIELSVEILKKVKAGENIKVKYLLGNTGMHPIWINQNEFVPALINWKLSDEKTVININGDDIKDTISKLPFRQTMPLNPGEYLAWERILGHNKIKTQINKRYTLQASIDAKYFTSNPDKKQEPIKKTLTGSFDFIAEENKKK